jgi:arsenate reductase
MAEALLRHVRGDRYDAYSAGTEPGSVHPLAVKVMAELGIDISAHIAKSVEMFLDKEFEYVITVCDQANEACPFFAGGKKRLHRSFQDPAAFTGSGEDRLELFRRVRDQIEDWVSATFAQDRNGNETESTSPGEERTE